MIQKSAPMFGDRPDWYRGLETHQRGNYYGSERSLWPGQTFVTHDVMDMVYRDNTGKISVHRNACAHAGAPLLDKSGEYSIETFRCPIHRWQYKLSGELIAAPNFKDCKNIKLHAREFGIWNGYVIGYTQQELDAALGGFGSELGLPLSSFNPLEFEYCGEIVYDTPYHPLLFVINFLDGYHVPYVHQITFDATADCGTYVWQFSSSHANHKLGYSIQLVRARKDAQEHIERLKRLPQNQSKVFGWGDLHLWIREHLSNILTPIDRDIFAVWALIYGNGHLMLELYEGGLFLAVSSLVNVDPRNPETGNKNPVEFYIHKSIPAEFRDAAKRKFVDAYTKSAEEDDEICKTLWNAHRLGNMNFQRVYHDKLEAGDVHWREWFQNHFVVKG